MHVYYCYIHLTIFTLTKTSRVEVNIKHGIIYGKQQITVFDQKIYFAFYGVPYARAPIGKLRFKDPKPPKAFLKPYDASTEYHGACAQAHIVHKHAMYGYEDCLHLNIYTPHLPKQKSNQKLMPIIVWVHGYAYTSSFSHLHGPDFLIEHDLLFISLTHRIGPFGFLKVNDSDSNINMGLKDIVIALKWIRSNAKYFGGDKNIITLMGSGSGGSFALLLLLTKYRKLFQKLIVQSSTMFSPSLFQGFNDLERLRLQNEIKKAGYYDFTKAPTNFIVSAMNKIYSSKDTINSQRPIVPFSPIIEEDTKETLLTKMHFLTYEKKANDIFNIPILTGFTTQESLSEVMPFIHNPSYLKSFAKSFKYMVPFSTGCRFNSSSGMYVSIADTIKYRYFKNYPDISLEEFLTYTSDINKYPIYKFIQTQIKHNHRSLFVYKFHYNGKFNAVKLTSMAGIKRNINGAAHGDEICYILKCEPLWESYVKIKSNIHDRDRRFMKQIAAMWANFAKFGNPTVANYYGNETWPPMTSEDDKLLLIKKNSKVISSIKESKMYEFWNDLYDKFYSSEHCNNDHDEL